MHLTTEHVIHFIKNVQNNLEQLDIWTLWVLLKDRDSVYFTLWVTKIEPIPK